MKKMLIVMTLCVADLIGVWFYISSNYIYLSSYNGNSSGLVNVKKVESIDLNESDNTESRLKKISDCVNLKNLIISCDIDDLYFFDGVDIDQLYIISNCDNWESIECLKGVRDLYINPMISDDLSTFNDCSVLKKLDSIEELTITNFEEEIDYSGIEELLNLKSLSIYSGIIDFGKIRIPSSVDKITLQTGLTNKGDNAIENIRRLNNTDIKTISMSNSYISDFSFVTLLENIKSIEFRDCIFAEKESDINVVISNLKSKNIEVSLENCEFSE